MKDLISRSRKKLSNPYAHLNGAGKFDAIIPDTGSQVSVIRESLQNPYAYLESDGEFHLQEDTYAKLTKSEFKLNPDALRKITHKRKDRKISLSEIEQIAFELHKELWIHRDILSSDSDDINPIELLEP